MSSNPYAAPGAPLAAAAGSGAHSPQLSTARRRVVWSYVALGGAVLAFALAAALAVGAEKPLTTVSFAGASMVAFVGVATSVSAIVAASRARVAGPGLFLAGAIASLLNFGMMAVGVLAAWLSTWTFSRGRQLRSMGRVLLPPLSQDEAWSPATERIAVDDSARAGLAARWRENARTEHASVGAFARLTLDLMALGAPPALVAAAQRDALDEIAHTEACFAIARALDGDAVGPGRFPAASRARTLPRMRALALAVLAVDSLVDGALHEGVSARVIAQLARRCEEPTIRAVLKKIAADEGRHAAHGWDVVEWCVGEGGETVLHALRGALKALPRTMRTPLPEPAADGSWEKWGIHGHALEAAEYAKARAHVARRVGSLLIYRRSTSAEGAWGPTRKHTSASAPRCAASTASTPSSASAAWLPSTPPPTATDIASR